MIPESACPGAVIRRSFQDFSIHSICDTPVNVLELLQDLYLPTIQIRRSCCFSSGPGSAVYSERSFCPQDDIPSSREATCRS